MNFFLIRKNVNGTECVINGLVLLVLNGLALPVTKPCLGNATTHTHIDTNH